MVGLMRLGGAAICAALALGLATPSGAGMGPFYRPRQLPRSPQRLAPVAAASEALSVRSAASQSGAEDARRVPPGELRAALAAARPGETLHLQAGVHRGRFELARPVRLVGEPGAVIAGDGSGTVLTLSAPGIEISDLVIRGSGADLAADDAVVLLRETEQVVVRNCRIEARAFGIYLLGGGRHHVVDNVVVGDASLPVARRGNGVHLWRTVDNQVTGNRLVDTRDGVYLSFAHDNRIENNSGSGLRYGIHYMYSERNTLAGNLFRGCRGGIALMYSRDNRIRGNVLEANNDFGILLLQLERSSLQDNVASGNGRGVYLENSAANEIRGNRLRGNGVGAYLTAGSENNVFSGNRFDANVVQVYDEHAGDNDWSDAERGNFWSDYGGFDWNGDGVGDTPYRIRTAASALLARRPLVRWLWRSPILGLLDWWEGQMATAGVAAPGDAGEAFDRYPLVGSAGEGAAPESDLRRRSPRGESRR